MDGSKVSSPAKTKLVFQTSGDLHELRVLIRSVRPFEELEELNRALFKNADDSDYVVVTDQTIFHPQGGGQPSDTGVMTTDIDTVIVTAARMDAVCPGQVLHLGHFENQSSPTSFVAGATVEQRLDADKRLLYSRLHTAGHVLGAATRKRLQHEVEGFDELKASHFPDMAACEFVGSIDGKWKQDIQEQVDEYIQADLPVEIDWWTRQDFVDRGLERLVLGNDNVAPGEKFRVVKIIGADTYPCGGTHVSSTKACGPTSVRKITRNKGVSRVSYSVA